MIRSLLRLVLVLTLLTGTTLTYFWFYRNYYTCSYAASLIPVTASVETAEFHTDSLFFKKSIITSTSHSTTDIAFAVPHIELRYQTGELFSRPHHIRKLQIESPLINLEIQSPNGAEHSIVPIMRKLSADTSSTLFTIDSLTLSNVRFSISNRKTGEIAEIPPIKLIEINELGKAHGITISEVLYAAIYQSLENLTDQQEFMNITNMLTEPKVN